MTGRDYRRAFLDRWPVIAAGVLVGLIVAGALAFLAPARYSSSVTLFVTAPTRSSDANQTYQSDVLARERTKYYIPLVTENRVAQEVAQRVGGGVTARQVAGSVVAASPEDTPLLQLTVSDSSPARAQAMAAATGDAVVELIRDVEVSTAGGGTPQISASIVQPATFSADPVSLGRVVQLALGAVVGLVAGAGIALVLQLRDRSVDSADELRRETRLPVLATISSDRDARRRPAVWGPDLSAARTEEFRRLRAALAFVGEAGESRVLMLASALADEDTTLTALSLSHVVAATGRSVVLVEADLRRPRLAEILDGGSGGGLTRVLQGRAQVRVMLRRDPTGTFDVLVAGEVPDDPSVLLSGPELPATLRWLAGEYQVVIVDAPALLPVVDAGLVARHADEVVLVAARGRASTDDALEALTVLRQAGATVVGTVFTGGRPGPRPPGGPADPGARRRRSGGAATTSEVSEASEVAESAAPPRPVPVAHVTLPSQARSSSGGAPPSARPTAPSLSAPTVSLRRAGPPAPASPASPASPGTRDAPGRPAVAEQAGADDAPTLSSGEAEPVADHERGSSPDDPPVNTPKTGRRLRRAR